MTSKRRPWRDKSIRSRTEREPTEGSGDYTSQDEIVLLANPESSNGTPTQDDRGYDNEAVPRNHQARTAETVEASDHRSRPSELEPRGMHPQGICELKHPVLDQVGPPLSRALDLFDAESVMVSGFDMMFACDSIDMGTASDAGEFDTARIMSADFDAFYQDLTGLFDT